MSQNYSEKIASELGISNRQVSATMALLEEGGTVPFIARYRKEMTGSLDEVAIAAIRDRAEQLKELDKRREAILKSLEEQKVLTEELREKVMGAETMAVLEDIYLPYKPKRRTKATIAREKGLEPLATKIMEQGSFDLQAEGGKFVDSEKEVNSAEEALEGARHIIAEWINEDATARSRMRELYLKEGTFRSRVMTGKEEEGKKFKDYFEWEEPVSKAPSHRILAMRRGEKELVLMLDIAPEEDRAIHLLEDQFVKGSNAAAEQVQLAVKDAYKRLLKPSMETEIRLNTKKKADEEAIRVFAENLRELLLTAPLGQKSVMAIDPGFRTGCKLVCLNAQGKLLEYQAIFPNEPQRKIGESANLLYTLCEKHQIEAIAIGNGTASRETESFVRSLKLPGNPLVVMVNESGASIYSASEVAREEFPDQDLTVRGAVSIGRRLMDPLAELVKLDPKSIGVGQYQHDVDQGQLKQSLDDTVMSCVNRVGVEVNTASKQLLTYVSGLGPSLAQNIINYRNENGPFKERNALKKVPRLGDKAFEQAAGFLRIHNAENPLDGSAVHPERYAIVKQMAKDVGCTIDELMASKEKRSQIELKKYVSDTVGLPTLQDILAELEKPGRDPRQQFEAFAFEEGVNTIDDLKVGMKLPGIVTNVTNFGAFVDVGVHQDGLVHISHLADQFVSNPAEVVSVQQQVMVTVVEVDVPRNRIGLSLKSDPFAAPAPKGKGSRSGDSRNGDSRNGDSRNNSRRNNGGAKEEEGDMAAMLQNLKNKFGGR
ncbi:Tex family protein [Nafulsella turpanensis]|uniref:Tex family protein n=1 Tax=Nafulsella turpanensis TaxID=1265690 RepID=UPI00034A80F9|nr:Tex family protein [Nafulsella turpanensis]